MTTQSETRGVHGLRLRAQDPSAEVLEPKLTALDKRVLKALNSAPPVEVLRLPLAEQRAAYRAVAKSEWQVAEALRIDSVQEVRAILSGLARMHYVLQGHSGRPPYRWYRTEKGSDALEGKA